MSSQQGESSRELRINEAIASYLDAERRGAAPPPEQWLHEHTDIAAELKSFLGDREQFRQDAAPLGLPVAEAPTLAPSEMTAPMPGTTIRYFGDYELVSEIPRGGMGVVYRAIQVNVHRPVALKMILSGQLASADDVRRFHTEAEAAANLDHPNIVPIYEVGDYAGQHYFSMKLIEGDSLARQIPPYVADPQRAARLFATVARAVHHAH